MTTAKDVLKMIKDNDVKYVDFRFTDPRGKWQHVTFDKSMIEEDTFAEGQMFDGSSIAGWKAIHESDMTLMPDPATATHRSVLRRDDAVDRLRRARADHGRALQSRSARHRQEGRGDGQVDGRRRHGVLRSGSRVLHVRRRALLGRALQDRLQGGLDRIPHQLRHRLRGWQSRPPHRHQEGLLPGSAAGYCAGHALRDARRHGEDGRQGREASPRGGVRAA